MEHTAIPKDELEVFKSLENIRVVFDVGIRDDVDYLIIKPSIELHAFEPNPLFIEQLKVQIGNRKRIYINNYGLGDKFEELPYDPVTQSFLLPVTNPKLPIKTLDWYVKKNNIKQIDFLKIDAEGYDYKILLGGKKAIKISRYIQFEWGADYLQWFKPLLKDFDMDYIGGRNVICTRKGEKKPWIPEYPLEGGLIIKDESNRLRNI